MVEPDVFVGSVAIGIGTMVVMASIFNWQWYYKLQKARWVESLCGRNGARVVFAIVGLSLIALGTAITIDFGASILRSSEQEQDLKRRSPGNKKTSAIWHIESIIV